LGRSHIFVRVVPREGGPGFFSGGPSRGRSRYSVSIDRMLVIFLLGVVWVGPFRAVPQSFRVVSHEGGSVF
jgi:hypothetical protein